MPDGACLAHPPHKTGWSTERVEHPPLWGGAHGGEPVPGNTQATPRQCGKVVRFAVPPEVLGGVQRDPVQPRSPERLRLLSQRGGRQIDGRSESRPGVQVFGHLVLNKL